MADNKEELICPACGEIMTKVFVNGSSINVDICLNGCGGVLFDNRELEKCDEQHENASEILEKISGREFKNVDTSLTINCPVCGATMMKMGAGVDNVEIDVCALCGAKFLNNGELQNIREGEKDIVGQQVLDNIDIGVERFINELTYGMKPEKGSPRRQFVEDMVRRFLFR